MSQVMVIYHANCTDGWCAAWVMDRCFGGCELVAANHGDSPPKVDGRTVFVVDFSYPRDVMVQMREDAHNITVLDHHKTAQEDCKGLDFCIFDDSRSGAKLAYDWCMYRGYVDNFAGSGPNNNRAIASGMKYITDYVQDRDLWQFKLPNSQYINANIRSFDHDLKQWDMLAIKASVTPETLVNSGMAITRYRDQLIASHMKRSKMVVVSDVSFPLVECTSGEIVSDLLQGLAINQQMAAGWQRIGNDTIKVSLRSSERGDDVSSFAKIYGGGGHEHSAAFVMHSDMFENLFFPKEQE